MKVNWSATLLLSDTTDKQMSWLVNVTFDWRQVMTTAVERYGWIRCLITFVCHVICTINTESSQLIYRNYLKIKCKYKNWNLTFLTFVWWSQWLLLKFYKKRFALHGILTPPTGFITWWMSKKQILILKWYFKPSMQVLSKGMHWLHYM